MSPVDTYLHEQQVGAGCRNEYDKRTLRGVGSVCRILYPTPAPRMTHLAQTFCPLWASFVRSRPRTLAPMHPWESRRGRSFLTLAKRAILFGSTGFMVYCSWCGHARKHAVRKGGGRERKRGRGGGIKARCCAWEGVGIGVEACPNERAACTKRCIIAGESVESWYNKHFRSDKHTSDPRPDHSTSMHSVSISVPFASLGVCPRIPLNGFHTLSHMLA